MLLSLKALVSHIFCPFLHVSQESIGEGKCKKRCSHSSLHEVLPVIFLCLLPYPYLFTPIGEAGIHPLALEIELPEKKEDGWFLSRKGKGWLTRQVQSKLFSHLPAKLLKFCCQQKYTAVICSQYLGKVFNHNVFF